MREALRFVPILLLLPVIGACASVASPDGWVSPEIVDETIFISLDDGEISALNLATLNREWTFPADDEDRCPGRDDELDLKGIYGAPAIHNDVLYVGAYDGYIYSLSRDDGECLWSFKTEDPVTAGPILDGDRLYAPSTDGKMYIIDSAEGELVETVETGATAATPLLTDDGYLFVGTETGKLWRFSTDPLEPAWTSPFEVRTGLLTPPVLTSDETVVVGGIGAKLFGIDVAIGDERWSLSAGNWFWGEPVVYGEGDAETVVATNLDGKVYAVEAGTGEGVWPAVDTGQAVRAGPAVSDDGTIVVVNNAGVVFFIDVTTGEILDEVELKKGVYASPVINDGNVYVLSRDRTVFLIDLETGRALEVAPG